MNDSTLFDNEKKKIYVGKYHFRETRYYFTEVPLHSVYSFCVTCDQCFRSSLKAIPSIMMNKMEVVLVMVYRATVTNLRLHWLRPMSQEEATPTGATLEM